MDFEAAIDRQNSSKAKCRASCRLGAERIEKGERGQERNGRLYRVIVLMSAAAGYEICTALRRLEDSPLENRCWRSADRLRWNPIKCFVIVHTEPHLSEPPVWMPPPDKLLPPNTLPYDILFAGPGKFNILSHLTFYLAARFWPPLINRPLERCTVRCSLDPLEFSSRFGVRHCEHCALTIAEHANRSAATGK